MRAESRFVERRVLELDLIISAKKMEFGLHWHGCKSWLAKSNRLKKFLKNIGLLMGATFSPDMTMKIANLSLAKK